MAKYSTEDIRNVVFLGHAGAGKTTLAEAILHKTGATSRLGSVDDKTSILDCDELEKEAHHSLISGCCHVNHKGKEINILDTPGYPDFLGSALSALPGAETALIIVSGSDGVQVNTRRLYNEAKKRNMARMIVVNKIDAAEDLPGLVEDIRESFGRECVCANLPKNDGSSVIDCIINHDGDDTIIDVEKAHTDVIDTVVEVDDELMEFYLGGEELSKEQIYDAFVKAMALGSVVPIVFCSAKSETGITELLDKIANRCPSPANGRKAKIMLGEGDDQVINEVEPAGSGDALGVVVRVANDPKTNIKYSTIRLLSGTIKSDSSLHRLNGKKAMRCGHINKLQGDHLEDIGDGIPGDIVTLAKLDEIHTLDTVYTGKEPGRINVPSLPVPMFSLAITPKKQGDETKISIALAEIIDSEPTFRINHDSQTHETVVSGLGELHLKSILDRIQHRRGIEMDTKPPQIPYRETITSSCKYIEYTHKKQSGGAGQFAKVVIDMEPNERGGGYEFQDKIFGGVIDQPLRPSVDKGCQQAMDGGVIGGFNVVDVKVSLVDGKTHPVDSKDIAFQIAGREAFRKAFMECKPTLLEPIVDLEVTVPSENVGDITGDLASRRGRVQGQDVIPGGMTVIQALVPLSEIQQYNSQLKSVTSGQGTYTMELSHYEDVPSNVTQQIIAKRKAAQEAQHA